MRTRIFLSVFMALLFSATVTIASDTKDETIYVPIRGYYIFNDALGTVSVSRDQQSINDSLLAANLIWQQAGIRFYFEHQAFHQPADLTQYQNQMGQDEEFWAINTLCPRTRNGLKGIDFCIVGQLKSNRGPYEATPRFRSKRTGRFEKPKLGRSNVRAPILVVPVKSGSRKNLNAIKLAAELGNILRLERHDGDKEAMFLMGRLPKNIYFGSDYSAIKLSEKEIKQARSNAEKIAKKPESDASR